MTKRKLLTGSLLFVAAISFYGTASQAEPSYSKIKIGWACTSRTIDPSYPCSGSTQTVRIFRDGRALLQEDGELCMNENRRSRVSYDAFANKSSSGNFTCVTRNFDFTISYSTRVKMADDQFGYTISGSLRQQLRAGENETGQRLRFSTEVNIAIDGGRCKATRQYRFSDTVGGVPRVSNAVYNYVSTVCSVAH